MKIVSGKPEYAQYAADFFTMTGEELQFYMFGKNHHRMQTECYKLEQGIFSYKHSLLAIDDNEMPVGIVQHIDYETHQKELKGNSAMIKHGGFSTFRQFVRMRTIMDKAPKKIYQMVEPGYGYIVYLAVSPKFRSKGIGAVLIDKVANIYREKGLKYLTLDVETENEDAVRFYERNNFSRDYEFAFKFGKKIFPLYRMVMEL